MDMSFSSPQKTRYFKIFSDQSSPEKYLDAQLKKIHQLLLNNENDHAIKRMEDLITNFPTNTHVLQVFALMLRSQEDFEYAIKIYDRLLTHTETASIWSAKAVCYTALKQQRRATLCFSRARALSNSVEQDTFAEETSEDTTFDSKRLLEEAKQALMVGSDMTAFRLCKTAALTDVSGEAIALAKLSHCAYDDLKSLYENSANIHASPAVLAQIALDFPASLSSSQQQELMNCTFDSQRTVAQKAQANLALFRLHDVQDKRMEALAYLRKYHELSAQIHPYKRSQDTAEFTALKRLEFNALCEEDTSLRPIFVTGLPGAQQDVAINLILQNQPDAISRDLSIVPKILARFLKNQCCDNTTDTIHEAFIELQHHLRAALKEAAQGHRVIIETSPLNYKFSGILAAALPEARILHMKNDIMSTGWAIHTLGSKDPKLFCQHDLHHLNAFQKRSAQIMKHWEEKFGPQIISVELATSPPKQWDWAHNLLGSLGMEIRGDLKMPDIKANDDWKRYASYLLPLRQPLGETMEISSFLSQA